LQLAQWWTVCTPYASGALRLTLGLSILTAAALGLDAAESELHARKDLPTEVTFELIGVPRHLDAALQAELATLRNRAWLDETLCQDVHRHLAASAWIRTVRRIGKGDPGVVYVDCEYRHPIALVEAPEREYYCLIDEWGVRLPGTYRLDPAWLVISGIEALPPAAGRSWSGEDVTIALELGKLLRMQSYGAQVGIIDVLNHDGRHNPRTSHIVLKTSDHAATILWGSAPGQEFEENTVAEKLRILSANHEEHGRIDGHHSVIDISVFPDRFIVRS
jgi:hypothetical protein